MVSDYWKSRPEHFGETSARIYRAEMEKFLAFYEQGYESNHSSKIVLPLTLVLYREWKLDPDSLVDFWTPGRFQIIPDIQPYVVHCREKSVSEGMIGHALNAYQSLYNVSIYFFRFS